MEFNKSSAPFCHHQQTVFYDSETDCFKGWTGFMPR